MLYLPITAAGWLRPLQLIAVLQLALFKLKARFLSIFAQVSGYGNNWIRPGEEVTRITPSQIEQSVEASLQRLGTDHLDLLQVSRLCSALVLKCAF